MEVRKSRCLTEDLCVWSMGLQPGRMGVACRIILGKRVTRTFGSTAGVSESITSLALPALGFQFFEGVGLKKRQPG